MSALAAIARLCDWINEQVGRHVMWLAALLVLIGVSLVKDDAVACAEQAACFVVDLDDEALVGESRDGADADAAGLGESPGDELLVVDSREESVCKSA